MSIRMIAAAALTTAALGAAALTAKADSGTDLPQADLDRVAAVCETAAGTVKAQRNRIYKKAGVSGRQQLLSLCVEELMAEPLVIPAADTCPASSSPRRRGSPTDPKVSARQFLSWQGPDKLDLRRAGSP